MSFSSGNMRTRSTWDWCQLAGPLGDSLSIEMAKEAGAWWFGKIPGTSAFIGENGEIQGESKVTGEVRSLLDPESPPAGSDFYLAWFDGVLWRNSIPSVELRTDASPRIRQAFDGSSLSNPEADPEPLKTFIRALGNGNEAVQRARQIAYLRALMKRPGESALFGSIPSPERAAIFEAKKALRRGDQAQALAIAFAAGRNHGHKVALDQLSSTQDDWTGNEWNVAAYLAIRRKGRMTATQLLTALGGSKTKAATHSWDFPSGAVLDQKTFQDAHKAASKRLDSEEAGEVKPFCLGPQGK